MSDVDDQEPQHDLYEQLSGEDASQPVPGGSIFDQYKPHELVLKKSETDGLPVEADPPWTPKEAVPIPHTPETVNCLAQPKSPEKPDGLHKCKYYKRQRVHNPAAPDRPFVVRFCCRPELRGINGAALVIGDSGIFGCEFRDPSDLDAERLMDIVDADKIKKGQERLKLEKESGQVHGYRMFRNAEDVEKGRFMVDEGDFAKPPKANDPLGEDK